MGTTNTYGFHYPESTDPPNGAAQMQQLAEDVEDALSNLDTRVTLLDSGWQDITSQCTPLNSSIIQEVSVRRYGPVVCIYAAVTLGVSITVPDSGNVANTKLFALPTAWGAGSALNHQQSIGGPASAGSLASFLIDPGDNSVMISATTPNADLSAGTGINISGQYFTDH